MLMVKPLDARRSDVSSISVHHQCIAPAAPVDQIRGRQSPSIEPGRRHRLHSCSQERMSSQEEAYTGRVAGAAGATSMRDRVTWTVH
ncbi:hypothetical protein Mvan_2331 [Mycolicibacterium vanbaalenii PYR-1]|uniref:Uncharacterized protein n=1 Tax=Mycolicibacterium vanbaalenii (strain DSM 7251 / JCM 13017 / BCRC 16820 / KCTC 9966 / NRRL B-24157 / PYR-1) TaxID=350058 RepID=A1T7J5_MYCVP|nr:hypothetical protein Mvan_2331 [Mycolicibacterium vanbaalenii PYR-1]